jgi:hypothetical protein
MTRISSLIVATTLAILPLSAFAQQNATPAKTTAPATITSAAPATIAGVAPVTATPAVTAAAPVAGKTTATATAKVIQPAKSDVKSPMPAAKTEVHGSNPVTSHHAKANVPTKVAEPAKS